MARKIPIERVGEILHTVLSQLKSVGGEAKLKELLTLAEPKLALSDYEKGVYPKSGYVRWQALTHFYSIDCVKAGYITKSGGRWKLTSAGEEALQQNPKAFILGAIRKYREWKSSKLPPERPVREEEES